MAVCIVHLGYDPFIGSGPGQCVPVWCASITDHTDLPKQSLICLAAKPSPFPCSAILNAACQDVRLLPSCKTCHFNLIANCRLVGHTGQSVRQRPQNLTCRLEVGLLTSKSIMAAKWEIGRDACDRKVRLLYDRVPTYYLSMTPNEMYE